MAGGYKLDTSKLKALSKDLEPRAQTLLDKVTFDIEGTAKDLAPVLTGFLKNSGSSVLGHLKNIVQFTADYAVHQEFGTRFMSAHPFLLPAVEKHRAPFLAAWKQLIKQ